MSKDAQNERIRLEGLCAAQRLQPADAERLLALRAAELAAVPPASESRAAPIDVCVFVAGASALAIRTRSVAEVRDVRKLAPIPNAPPVVAGVIVHRAQLVGLVDLARLFETGRGEPAPHARVVLVEERNQQLAIVADDIVGVRVFDAAALAPPPPTFPPELVRYVEGIADDGVAVLDVPSLLRELRLA